MNELDLINAITREVQAILDPKPLRQEGDIDIFQLCKAWNKSESAVRRIMRAVGKEPEKTGFELLEVYDPDRRHVMKVLRKMGPK